MNGAVTAATLSCSHKQKMLIIIIDIATATNLMNWQPMQNTLKKKKIVVKICCCDFVKLCGYSCSVFTDDLQIECRYRHGNVVLHSQLPRQLSRVLKRSGFEFEFV